MNFNRLLTNPLLVFTVVWCMVVFFSLLEISYSFSGGFSSLFLLFFVSFLGFYLGYFCVRLMFCVASKRVGVYLPGRFYFREGAGFFIFAVVIFSIGIILLNFFLEGLPPFFSILGYETRNYLEYGRLKGVLFGLVIFLFLISFYFSSVLSFFLKVFCLSVLILYVSRGLIVFSVLSYLFLVLLEERFSSAKILAVLVSCLAFMILVIGVVGEYRTGTENFYNALEIKEEFRGISPGIIWVISYVSMPVINIIEVSKVGEYFYGQVMLSSALPAFMAFDQVADSFYQGLLPNPYNTVAGYLKNVFLDFGWVGVLVYNFILGALFYVSAIKFSSLSRAVLLGALFFLFFHDFFVNFTTIFVVLLFYFFNRVFGRLRIAQDFEV